MPAKKGPKLPTREELEAAALEVDEHGMTAEERELAEFFEQIGSDFEVHITRFETNGDRGQCGKYSWDLMRDDPSEFLRKEWGPGKYQLTFRRSGAGWSGLYGAKRITVAKKPDNLQQHTNGAGPASLAELQVTLLRDQLQQQREMFTMMLNQKGGGSDIEKLVTGLGALFRPPDPVAQFAALMTAVNSSKNENPFSSIKEILEISRSLTSNGNSSEEKSWISIAEKVLDKLPALTAGKPPAAAPAEKLTPAAAPQKTEAELEAEFIKELGNGIDLLRADFKAAVKQEDAAKKVWDGQQAPHYNAVVAAISGNATVEQLFMFMPALVEDAAEKMWFEMVYDSLRKMHESATTPKA